MPRTIRSLELKIVPIGNSRGVRLPKAVLDKYAIRDAVVVEEREEGACFAARRISGFPGTKPSRTWLVSARTGEMYG